MRIRFSDREMKDLLVAWLALGLAFAIFINYDMVQGLLAGQAPNPIAVAGALAVSLLTAGIGFLLHELAHKVVAVRFGQIAEFRADYNMLFLAVVSALAGFLFAAPGAVHHRGRISKKQNGLIALAGPVTNVGLGLLFAIPFVIAWFGFFGGILFELARLGIVINLLLAGFNMIPFGPLDGKTVVAWNKPVYVAVAVPCIALAAGALIFIGI